MSPIKNGPAPHKSNKNFVIESTAPEGYDLFWVRIKSSRSSKAGSALFLQTNVGGKGEGEFLFILPDNMNDQNARNDLAKNGNRPEKGYRCGRIPVAIYKNKGSWIPMLGAALDKLPDPTKAGPSWIKKYLTPTLQRHCGLVPYQEPTEVKILNEARTQRLMEKGFQEEDGKANKASMKRHASGQKGGMSLSPGSFLRA
jgi:hypothetical protein